MLGTDLLNRLSTSLSDADLPARGLMLQAPNDGELVWVAPLSGLVVCVTYSLVILGTARAEEARREGAGGQAFAFSALAIVAFLAFVAAVVYGISIITTK